MKTAVFINTLAKMSNYDLNDVDYCEIKKIAIVEKSDFSLFKEKYGKYFSAIVCSLSDPLIFV